MDGTEPASSIVAASHVIQRPMPSIRGDRDRAARDSSLHVPIDRKLFPESTHDVEPVAGTRLGHFVIEEQIGRGGMGAVFRAIDQRLGRVVALKVLAPDQSRDPASVQRFLNEARAAARLDHENVARVFFIGEDQGLQFIAFEFVTGTNVREFLHIRGKLSVEEAVNYTLQVALALRHTAAAGVVHRDIKPSNIVISASGRAKLVDLGLARTQAVGDGDELTVAGTALGTFDYISPEQARDPRLVDVRSDIYSLGCTLYHMLTGEPPFPQGTMFEKVIEHHGSRPPDPSLKNPSVSPQLARLVQKMMASQPDERYATPDLLIQELVEIAQSMGLRATAPDSPVWVTPLFDHPGFWEANRGWLVTLALLLLIAVFIDRFPWEPAPQGDFQRDTVARTSTASDNESDDTPRIEADSAADAVEQPADEGAEDAIPYSHLLSPAGSQDLVGHPAANSHSQIEHGSITGSSGTGGLGSGVFSGSVDASQGIAANTQRNPGIGRSTPGPRPNGGSTDETQTTSNATSPAASSNAFRVVEGGVPMGSYPTLEAACVAAHDNAIIEVTGTGSTPLRESRIRVAQKRLTIQATGAGRPTIEFVPAPGVPTQIWNCVDIVDGALTISGVDLIVRAQNGSTTSVFSLVRTRELRLSEATVTLVNPSGAPAQIIEVPLPGSAERMEMMATDVLEVDISYTLVRGNGSFLVNRSESSVDARFQQSAIAMSDDFFRMECTGLTRMDQVADGAECRIEFDHCTCVSGHNLLNVSVPMEATVPEIEFAVDDSIVWIASSTEPLIAMRGDKQMDELMDMLQWRGYINHIHVSGNAWWEIDAPFSTVGAFESWSSREWRDFWRDADDQPLGADVLPGNFNGRWASVQLADLMLQMGEDVTPLRSNDGRTPGVDWLQGPIPAGFPRVQ